MMLLSFTAVSIPAAEDTEKQPDMALLEYLAELVEVDGELVGPMDMVKPEDEKAVKQLEKEQDDVQNDDNHKKPSQGGNEHD